MTWHSMASWSADFVAAAATAGAVLVLSSLRQRIPAPSDGAGCGSSLPLYVGVEG
jgi:hypothetical protein